MINVFAALGLLEAVVAKGQAVQAITDAKLLYGIEQQAKAAGKLDIGAMGKAGTLKPAVDALARTTTLASTLMADKDQAANVAALLESLA